MGSLRSLRQNIPQSDKSYRKVGSKFNSALGIAAIARLVRDHLKDEYPNGKFSVSIDRARSSLTVVIKSVDFQVVNPGWVVWRVNNPRATRNNAPPHYTPEADALIQRISEFVEEFKFEFYDAYYDYRHVNFFSSITFDDDLGEFVSKQEYETAKRLGLPTDLFHPWLFDRQQCSGTAIT